jgi:hypothetical protein
LVYGQRPVPHFYTYCNMHSLYIYIYTTVYVYVVHSGWFRQYVIVTCNSDCVLYCMFNHMTVVYVLYVQLFAFVSFRVLRIVGKCELICAQRARS